MHLESRSEDGMSNRKWALGAGTHSLAPSLTCLIYFGVEQDKEWQVHEEKKFILGHMRLKDLRRSLVRKLPVNTW